MIAESYGGNPSIVNYLIFLTAFAFLSLFYLIPATLNEKWSIHPLLMVMVDALNMILWLCGAIALPAYLHAHSCSNRVCSKIFSELVKFNPLTCHITGLPRQQLHHQRFRQHAEALPRGTGQLRIPLVRMGLIHRLHRSFILPEP